MVRPNRCKGRCHLNQAGARVTSECFPAHSLNANRQRSQERRIVGRCSGEDLVIARRQVVELEGELVLARGGQLDGGPILLAQHRDGGRPDRAGGVARGEEDGDARHGITFVAGR